MRIEIDPYRSTSPRKPRYCYQCDEFVSLVRTGSDEMVGHCPLCGRTPGALEMGTEPGEEESTRGECIEMYGAPGQP